MFAELLSLELSRLFFTVLLLVRPYLNFGISNLSLVIIKVTVASSRRVIYYNPITSFESIPRLKIVANNRKTVTWDISKRRRVLVYELPNEKCHRV